MHLESRENEVLDMYLIVPETTEPQAVEEPKEKTVQDALTDEEKRRRRAERFGIVFKPDTNQKKKSGVSGEPAAPVSVCAVLCPMLVIEPPHSYLRVWL